MSIVCPSVLPKNYSISPHFYIQYPSFIRPEIFTGRALYRYLHILLKPSLSYDDHGFHQGFCFSQHQPCSPRPGVYGSNCAFNLRLGGFCEWAFLGHDTLLYSVKWHAQHFLNAGKPRFSLTRLRLSPEHEISSTILNNSSRTIQAAKSRRCLNNPSMITKIASILRTLTITCGITVLLPMIGLHS
ncbi:hypothetical protein B9Z19DRAFT_684581 [Tuber borchii]|uniref:Uncharacterized protein n=1 Tax=Tuber borchii TaxID=42251 RepID=A0A2T6ZA65_TUBBO|nr:hypothetical protein B9Z19DRAFT_684581 [Tuber borchii]